MLDKNININSLTLDNVWELLKNEIVYFQQDLNNPDLNNYIFFVNKNNNELPATLEDYLLVFKNKINKDLIEENKQLKKRIKELTRLEKYKIFDSVEPKKKIKVTKEELEKIKELKAKKVPVRIIADTYGVTEQTIYNYLKR